MGHVLSNHNQWGCTMPVPRSSSPLFLGPYDDDHLVGYHSLGPGPDHEDTVAYGYTSGIATPRIADIGYDPAHGINCDCHTCVNRFGQLPTYAPEGR